MRLLAGALAALLVVPAFANDQTDVVKLKSGRFITGTIVIDEADKDGFKVQRWDTGGTILVKWNQITEMERNRLLNKSPEQGPVGSFIDGVVAMTATRDVIGVLKKEDATQLLIKTKDAKTPVPVPKSALLRPHELRKIAESDAYSPDEMVDLRLAAANEKDYAAMRDLGRFAARLKLYERAKELYQKAAAADPAKKDEIEEIIAANEVLIKEGKAAALLKQIKELIGDVEFAKAVEMAKKLLAEYPETEVARQNKDLAATIDKQAKEYESRKAEYLAKEVPDMYKSKRSSLLSTYSSTKFKIGEAMNLANKLDETVVADLAKKLKSTPEEIQAAWAKREMKQRTVGYGDGSWIVKGGQDGGLDTDAKTNPQQQQKNNNNNNNGGFGMDTRNGRNTNNQNQNKPVDLGRKLETKDQWWANASSSDRKNFLEADYAKNSSAVKKEIKTKKCSVCNGEGIRKETRMGVACDCKCTRCHGSKEDEIIVYW